MRAVWLGLAVACAGVALTAAQSPGAPRLRQQPIVGLDHIPFVVRDLAAAAESYRRLGFALKPGRVHANGITNTHVKFEDGAGIELITAPAGVGAAVDDLTTKYRELLDTGEGPVFFGLHARNTDRLTAALGRGRFEYASGGGTIDIRERGLDFVFFVQDNRSPTDRPEHFAHRNGASALVRVWLAPADGASLRRLLEALGGSAKSAVVSVPTVADATVVRVENGEVVILPRSHQVISGRPIVGATFRVSSAEATGRYFTDAGIAAQSSVDVTGTRRVVVSPSATHGMWLEFREGDVVPERRVDP